MKDHCHIPAPHFHCKPKCSLIESSEKLWDGTRSGEFKDQEWGEIPVSCAILNHFYSRCRSSGFIAGKLCCTERLSFPPRSTNQNLIHGKESLGILSLPCALESCDEEVLGQEMTPAVQGSFCSVVRWDWVGHAAGLHNFMVQAFLALFSPEAEVWITQTVLWLKSSAASPVLLVQHRSCTGEPQRQSTPLPQSHGHHLPASCSRSSCSTQLPAMYFVIVSLMKILIRSFPSQGSWLPAPYLCCCDSVGPHISRLDRKW